MILLVAAATGYLAGRLLWLLLRPVIAGQPALLRQNYRGHPVATAVGVILPLALVVVEAGRVVAGTLGAGPSELSARRLVVILLAAGLGLLGLVDDVMGDAGRRGFRGHLGALARGRLTTGGAKLIGGGALALVAVAPVSGGSLARLTADAALVALAANLANLLDRGPGRATKAGLAGFVVLAALTRAADGLAAPAVVAGAAAALLLDDLHERLMLGDAGANVLGGVLGLGVVTACAPGTRNVVLAAVLGLNLAGEVVSFSRVIAAVPPLHALDRAGRLYR
ncbi:MAG: hypothetical protein ACRDZW_04935 [Acidimicrobiales bacterium]